MKFFLSSNAELGPIGYETPPITIPRPGQPAGHKYLCFIKVELEFFVTKILVATVLFLDFHVDCYLLLLKNSILFILQSLNIFYSLYVTLKCFFNSEVLTFDR